MNEDELLAIMEKWAADEDFDYDVHAWHGKKSEGYRVMEMLLKEICDD